MPDPAQMTPSRPIPRHRAEALAAYGYCAWAAVFLGPATNLASRFLGSHGHPEAILFVPSLPLGTTLQATSAMLTIVAGVAAVRARTVRRSALLASLSLYWGLLLAGLV